MSTNNRPVFSQTRNPLSLKAFSFKRDPTRHYLLVEDDKGEYESMKDYFLGEMIDQSGDTPYIDHGYVKGECTSKKQSLMSCSKAYYEWVMRKNSQKSSEMVKAPEAVRGSQMTFERDAPVSIDGLNRIQQRDAKTGYPMLNQH